MSALVTCRRVNLLVQVADWTAKRDGIDPRAEPERFADHWARADPDAHFQLAHRAGMRLDPKAVLQFIEALFARAEHLKGAVA